MRYWSQAPHRVGCDQPNIGRALDDEGRALDGCCIRALAALREACLDQSRGVRQARHAQARSTLAAEVILQAFTIGGLRKHARERVFADAAWPGVKKRAGDALAAEH